MNTKTEIPAVETESPRTRTIKIFGVGGAGVLLADTLGQGDLSGADFVAIDTAAQPLEASSAVLKIHLETKMMRGLGTGGDPERGHALAEEQFSTLKDACEDADVIFIVAGLGGGAGSGISPVLARAAKETGALVLAFVTLPFTCEGNRRQQQAQLGLEQLKMIADGVICLPNQKAGKLLDENTGVLKTFQITGGMLIEGVRGIWQLLMRPGLIQIHFEDLCALIRDRHSESVFAFVETIGAARSREIIEKLLAHPLLDEGRALSDVDAVLVNLTGGEDLTMAEVNRVMEKISSQCDGAKVIMGAAIDPAMANKLSVVLVAGKNSAEKNGSGMPAMPEQNGSFGSTETAGEANPRFPRSLGATPTHQQTSAPRHPRVKRDKAKMHQAQLPLAIVSKGRFDKSEPTIHKGEDLDIPTYIRRGVPLN